MLTFLHAADLRLDAPFHSLSPDQASERRQEQRQLLTRLADAAREAEADVILLAGNLFDGQRARPEILQTLYQILEDLDAEIFLAPGSRDPWTPGSPYGRLVWPPHVHIFSSPAPERVELPELGAVVYGGAFTSPVPGEGPLEGFRGEEDRGMARLGCFHGRLTSGESRPGFVTEAQIAASGLDYLALGGRLEASGQRRAGRTWYAWPGCPEGRSFEETGEKGVYAGELEKGEVSLRFVPLARRRYLAPRLDVTGRLPEEALRDLMGQANPQDILRITLTGERDPAHEPDLTELTALASGYFYSAILRDETALSQSLWARAEEDTLTGLFLRNMRGRLDAAAEADRPLLERAVRFGLAALEGREAPR